MSIRKLRLWTAALVVAALGGPAGAAPIVGSITFSDGFTALSTTNTAVVSDLVSINVGSSTLAQACTDAFATAGACIPSSGTFASSFVLSNPISAQIVYTYNGFQFTVNNLAGTISRTGLSCSGSTCTDTLSFSGTGAVASTNPNFASGTFTMAWFAEGTCTAAGLAAACAPGTTRTAFWRSDVSTLGQVRVAAQELPEPTTLALLGLSALLVGIARRRNVA